MLIPIRFYDWDADFAYRPPLRDGVINTDHIISAMPHECSRCGSVVKVTLVGGGHVLCAGSIKQFHGIDMGSTDMDIKGGGD